MSVDDFEPAQQQVVTKKPGKITHIGGKPVAERLRFRMMNRDAPQSNSDGAEPTNTPESLATIRLYKPFNDAGSLKIGAVQLSSGATGQNAVRRGRDAAQEFKDTIAALDPSIPVSGLFRASNMNSLGAFHITDMRWGYEQVFKMAGAMRVVQPDGTTTPGRLYIPEVFFAQNSAGSPEGRVIELEDTVEVLKGHKAAGANVTMHSKVCYTRDPALGKDYMPRETRLFLKEGHGITGFEGEKDMYGGSGSPAGLAAGAPAELARTSLVAIHQHRKQYGGPPIIYAPHQHPLGPDSGVQALVERLQVYANPTSEMGGDAIYDDVPEIWFDVFPSGRGMIDMRRAIEAIEDAGFDLGDIREQMAILRQMEELQNRLEETFKPYIIGDGLWDDEALDRNAEAGGAAINTYEAAGRPLENKLMNPKGLNLSSGNARKAALETVGTGSRDFREKIAGHPHGVTPGARNRALAMRNIVDTAYDAGLFAQATAAGVDLTKPLPTEWRDKLLENSLKITDRNVTEYYRRAMPLPVDPAFRLHCVMTHYQDIFPPEHGKSILSQYALSADAYKEITDGIRAKPLNKNHAVKLMVKYKIPKAHAQDIAKGDVGENEHKTNHKSKPVLGIVTDLVDALDKEVGLAIPRDHAIFNAMVMQPSMIPGPDGEPIFILGAETRLALTKPNHLHPELWPNYVDPQGLTHGRWALKEAMIRARASTPNDLAKSAPAVFRSLLENFPDDMAAETRHTRAAEDALRSLPAETITSLLVGGTDGGWKPRALVPA